MTDELLKDIIKLTNLRANIIIYNEKMIRWRNGKI